MNIWKGEIIGESLSDASIVDRLAVMRIQELEDKDGVWHIYHVSAEESDVTTMGTYLKEGPWFIHFLKGEEMIVVFKDAFFKFLQKDEVALKKIQEYGRKLSIPESELTFQTNEFSEAKTNA